MNLNLVKQHPRTINSSFNPFPFGEKELGINPVIASITLGQERYFQLKHRTDKTLKHKILLEHGSLLLMQGETQHHWLHQIAKTKRPIGARINLTFRVVN